VEGGGWNRGREQNEAEERSGEAGIGEKKRLEKRNARRKARRRHNTRRLTGFIEDTFGECEERRGKGSPAQGPSLTVSQKGKKGKAVRNGDTRIKERPSLRRPKMAIKKSRVNETGAKRATHHPGHYGGKKEDKGKRLPEDCLGQSKKRGRRRLKGEAKTS